MEINKNHIGLIGCGNWGKQIVAQLVKLGCEVSVVARSQQSIDNAMQAGAARVLSSIGEFENLKGLIIATSTESHFSVIEESLPLKVPIFVEKPITANLEQTLFLRKKAAGQIFVMDKYRYHPAIKALAELIAKKELGNIRALTTKRYGREISTGPVDCIWDLAPHELSIVFTLLGHIPEIKYKNIDMLNNKPIGFTACFGDTPTVSCEVIKGCQFKSREVRILFSEALAIWNDKEEDSISIFTLQDLEQINKSAGNIIKVPKADPLKLELQAFLAFLDGGSEPMSNLDDACLFAQRISEITGDRIHS
jgi:predicted dehydrogenase